MSSKINLQTCEYACKSSIFQDNQLIFYKKQKITCALQVTEKTKQKTTVILYRNRLT